MAPADASYAENSDDEEEDDEDALDADAGDVANEDDFGERLIATSTPVPPRPSDMQTLEEWVLEMEKLHPNYEPPEEEGEDQADAEVSEKREAEEPGAEGEDSGDGRTGDA